MRSLPRWLLTRCKIVVVSGLGSFLCDCLMQSVIHNHCFISLSATRETILWLKQAICYCTAIPICTQFSTASLRHSCPTHSSTIALYPDSLCGRGNEPGDEAISLPQLFTHFTSATFPLPTTSVHTNTFHPHIWSLIS